MRRFLYVAIRDVITGNRYRQFMISDANIDDGDGKLNNNYRPIMQSTLYFVFNSTTN